MITFKISENHISSSHSDNIIVHVAYISGYRLGLRNYSKALWGLGSSQKWAWESGGIGSERRHLGSI